MNAMTLRTLLALPTVLAIGCSTSKGSANHQASSASPSSPAKGDRVSPGGSQLLALLPMNEGFGPADHDAYEARIAPVGSEHGMARDSAYSIVKFLGGAGPKKASTLGIWSLAAPDTVAKVMGDPRYQAQVPYRNELHDMQNAAMFMVRELPTEEAPKAGHVLLVGLLAMKSGYGFDDHAEYENALEGVMRRHQMRLVRTFRVDQQISGKTGSEIVAVSLWDLPSPESLGKLMSDPDYMANTEYRDRIHDMAQTTMYFVTPR